MWRQNTWYGHGKHTYDVIYTHIHTCDVKTHSMVKVNDKCILRVCKDSTETSCEKCNSCKAFGENRTHDPANLVRRSANWPPFIYILELMTRSQQRPITIELEYSWTILLKQQCCSRMITSFKSVCLSLSVCIKFFCIKLFMVMLQHIWILIYNRLLI